MTDWIEHTTNTCPVDPETVVEVRHTKHHRVSSGKALYMAWGRYSDRLPGDGFGIPVPDITHYRIITPAPTPPLFLGGDPAKPPEPEMVKSDWIKFTMSNGRPARYRVTAVGPNGAVPPTDDAPEVTFKYPLLEDPEPEMTEPDLITLRLECLKLAVGMLDRLTFREGSTVADAADDLLHYVLNGSVDKA
jgi:hypothetical protein